MFTAAHLSAQTAAIVREDARAPALRPASRRVLVRIDGRDYDVDLVVPSSDGVLGNTLIIHGKPLEV